MGISRVSKKIYLLYILRPCLSQLALLVVRQIGSKLWLLFLNVTSMAAILLLMGLVWLLLVVLLFKLLLALHHELRFSDDV